MLRANEPSGFFLVTVLLNQRQFYSISDNFFHYSHYLGIEVDDALEIAEQTEV